MRKDKDLIVAFFEKSGAIRYEATLNGDYRRSNREKPKLARVFKIFEEDHMFAQACIFEMIKSKNIVVRTDAAAYCLALKIDIDLGKEVLEEISKEPSNGIFGFIAQMTLKVWRENGELRMYQH